MDSSGDVRGQTKDLLLFHELFQGCLRPNKRFVCVSSARPEMFVGPVEVLHTYHRLPSPFRNFQRPAQTTAFHSFQRLPSQTKDLCLCSNVMFEITHMQFDKSRTVKHNTCSTLVRISDLKNTTGMQNETWQLKTCRTTEIPNCKTNVFKYKQSNTAETGPQ